ncbi:MAG: hypothetical protein EP338_13160 [Bacteroidetes bacterium]|nr:MAG: hypothetical protein EP338_13160 [Bacteroidota bacterium]
MVGKKLFFVLTGIMMLNINWAQKGVEEVFPLKWKTKIGVTTYRTNMAFHKGSIFIGSNGINRNFKIDSLDGVFQINAQTGAIEHHYKVPFLGDNDVNGVRIANDRLYFGTDNFYFFCFDLKSKQELWKTKMPGDVECIPQVADLNGDKFQDLAFPVEQAGFYALDGKTGEVLWISYGISSHSGNVSPLALDLNKDGVMDFVTSGRGTPNSNKTAGFKMAHYGDYHMAINGKNGEVLWMAETGAGVHASPFLYKRGRKIELLALDAYGELRVMDQKGQVIKRIDFGYDNFSSPVVTKDEHLVIGRGSIDFAQKWFTCDKEGPCYLKKEAEAEFPEIDGRISATTMIADVLNLKRDQLVGLTESGTLFLLETNGKVIHKLKFSGGAEASAFILDIDKDGKLELLIADLDGNLKCYETNSRAKATLGSFR